MMSALLPLLMILTPPLPGSASSEAGSSVGALLDRFHAAASGADEAAYFACFTSDGVFLGTDATERWSVEAFRAYARERFSQGRGWTYVPEERHVALSPDGTVAWFDERLGNATYGPCRGTGVAVRSSASSDEWRIAHYSLTLLVPNEKAADVVAVIGKPQASGHASHDHAVAQEAGTSHAHGNAHAHGGAGHGHAGHAEGDHATVTHRFDDIERWISVFDDPERDAWQKPAEVVAALGIAKGQVVADIGAGTGYFTPHLQRAVGDEGAVFAVEVEPAMVEHLRSRAEKDGLVRLIPILGSLDDPRLPRGVVDLAVIVNTYHHVDARIDYFSRLRASMARRGRLAVVEFIDGPRPVGPPPEHALSKEKIVAELAQAGWSLDAEHDLLPWQHFLVFRARK